MNHLPTTRDECSGSRAPEAIANADRLRRSRPGLDARQNSIDNVPGARPNLAEFAMHAAARLGPLRWERRPTGIAANEVSSEPDLIQATSQWKARHPPADRANILRRAESRCRAKCDRPCATQPRPSI